MNILLLGSGGRECAFAWKMRQSPLLNKLWIAPGNAGTALYGTNVALPLNDFDQIKKFVLENNIDILVVGPEDPLVNGIHDFFIHDEALKNIGVVGPQKEGARLEGSKDFAKEFMIRHSIPTARFRTFNKTNIHEADYFLESLKPPYVLKADGLAAGKGVLILDDIDEAKRMLKEMIFQEKFGQASAKVLIEEYLKGIELSVFVATDGISYQILPEAKDYKRIGEGDTGPNTGGMGSVSPVPFADKIFMQKVEQKIIIPTIEGLKKENIDYSGFIFIGLMNVNGDPYVIEYNVRMGDPESEAVIPRIKSDLVEMFVGIAHKTLSEKKLLVDDRAAACVMLVAEGYPGDYEKGKNITGLENVTDSLLFYAGAKKDVSEKILTNGGRVIAVTSFGKDLKEALEVSYRNVEKINFDGKYYRKDIGQDVM